MYYEEVAPNSPENMDFVDSWFLMESPLLVVIILVSYLLFVLKIGPNYMNDKKSYNLQNVMLIYNAGQVLMSCFLLYLTINMTWTHGLTPKTCIMKTEHRKPTAIVMHYYLLAKVSELLDTIFFVFRKKMKQVSFLHVYHHTLMVVVTWVALKYEPTYKLLFLGMLNSFVHVVMYTYYGLSSFPSMMKYLWWKKYITIIQLIQFVMVIIHFGVATMRSECAPSKILTVTLSGNIILFLYLFGSFYVDNYKKNDANTMKRKAKNGYENNLSRDKLDDTHGIVDTDTNSKTASITLGQKFRIRFNLETKKPQAS